MPCAGVSSLKLPLQEIASGDLHSQWSSCIGFRCHAICVGNNGLHRQRVISVVSSDFDHKVAPTFTTRSLFGSDLASASHSSVRGRMKVEGMRGEPRCVCSTQALIMKGPSARTLGVKRQRDGGVSQAAWKKKREAKQEWWKNSWGRNCSRWWKAPTLIARRWIYVLWCW